MSGVGQDCCFLEGGTSRRLWQQWQRLSHPRVALGPGVWWSCHILGDGEGGRGGRRVCGGHVTEDFADCEESATVTVTNWGRRTRPHFQFSLFTFYFRGKSVDVLSTELRFIPSPNRLRSQAHCDLKSFAAWVIIIIFFIPLSLLFLNLTLRFWKVSWHFDIPLAWHLNSPACTWAKPAGGQCERASNWILTPVRAALGGWHRPTTSPPLCPPGLKWKHFALTLPSFPLCFLADWAIKVTYWQASAGAHLNTCSVKEAPLWFHILRIARPGQSMMWATAMPNNLKSFERKIKKDHSDNHFSLKCRLKWIHGNLKWKNTVFMHECCNSINC